MMMEGGSSSGSRNCNRIPTHGTNINTGNNGEIVYEPHFNSTSCSSSNVDSNKAGTATRTNSTTSNSSSEPQVSSTGTVIVSVNHQQLPPPPSSASANCTDYYYYDYEGTGDCEYDEGEDDDDMDAESLLGDDAPWKKIQQNTFTRWTNNHLKDGNKQIDSLETDLSDGLALITLIEVLSGKTLPKYNKKPTFRSQKLENVSLILKFLEKDEGIKIVNIDSSDIVDCKLKLILGLIWHLILHYSISTLVWEGEEGDCETPKGTNNNDNGPTPKQRLLHWVQNRMPELPINNFTTDWNNGRAVGALVDAVAPGLCPDWTDWHPNNALQNAQEAMGLADDWLDVKQLITPEELVNPKVDELSMMTYLSQYPNAKIKPGAPLRPKKDPTLQRKCKAYGPGLDKGIVNEPNRFTIDTRGAGSGGLGLAIEGPSEAKMSCHDNLNGSCTVEYVPSLPGDYDISIKFADVDIPGSPFKVPVVLAPSKVENIKAYGPGLDPKNCRQNLDCTFRVDARNAGRRAPLGVSIIGLKDSPQVRDNGDGTYDVTYCPNTEGANLILNVTWDGKNIPNTPVHLKVKPRIEPNKVKVNGNGVSTKGVPASLPTEFLIDTIEAGYGDLEVQVLGPDSYPRKVKVSDHGDGIFKGSYVPDECGRYRVTVKYGGQDVPHSPFPVQAYATGSADKCKITEGKRKNLAIGEEYCITVNTKNAGIGAVTCRIRSTNGSSDLDIDIEDNGDGTFSIYYTVKDAGEYTLNIKFGGQPVPEGFYTFTADSHQNFVKEERVERQERISRNSTAKQNSSYPSGTPAASGDSSLYRPVELHHIPLPSTGGHVQAEIKMPSGNFDKPVIEDNRDGTVSVKYQPKEEGLHELGVKYNGEHVQGSPFKFHVDTITSGFVTAYGPGLTHGVSGEPAQFTISTKGAGAGGLGLSVEGPSKAEISCHDNKDGTVSVAYLPTAPGEYKISCKFGEKDIKGSPFTAKVTGEGRKRNQISVGSCSEVTFPGKVSDAELKALNASICAPSGLEEPCFLKRLPTGSIGISFTPREIGEHEVSVKKMGHHISNSPFKIQVAEREVGDAKKVKVSGGALKEGKTHTQNTFNVDTRDAGYGGLSLSVEGPSKAEISCQDKPDGTLDINYKPTEPGYYIINLKFADHHVDGSPFTAKISGEGTNRQRERIQRTREAVPVTEVGSECRLTFKMPGVSQFDLSSTVTSPGGVTEDAAINEVEEGLYAVHFVPKELGVHTVSVKFNQLHIPGSPFQFTVGPLRDGGAHRVHAGGPGLERGEQLQPCEFNIWTREAGAGNLAVSVEGPSKAEIDFKDRKDGSCYVSYIVAEPGEYRVGIKFNDEHIPDSPFKVYVCPDMGEARKVEIAQFPEGTIHRNKPSVFMVRKNGAKGQLDAKVVSPGGVEDDCFIDTVDFDTYSVRFMPKENGINNVHIKLNQVHVPGSPYRIKVGKDDADPAAVHAHGKGLQDVVTGQKTDFIIDTCNAGAGHLVVTIDGQSKVSMDCTEVDEGYKVRYTPLVPGDYYITIKYNGYHIVGSPFKVQCTGKEVGEKGGQETSSVVVETVQKLSKSKQGPQSPIIPLFKSDASKVTSKGMGLKKAFLQRQNQFTISATDAGNNILFIGMHGPKGPCDEVFIKHMGHNNYQVNYVCRERGEYIIICRWGDEHIPGSPFKVEV